MDHKKALLDSLADLRAAHDKATRLMAEIAATGARAMKGSDSAPSLTQLRRYAQALAQAQRQAEHCQNLILNEAVASWRAEEAGARPLVH